MLSADKTSPEEAFIFSTAFFQMVNGLVTHTPPVLIPYILCQM